MKVVGSKIPIDQFIAENLAMIEQLNRMIEQLSHMVDVKSNPVVPLPHDTFACLDNAEDDLLDEEGDWFADHPPLQTDTNVYLD